MFRNSIEGLEKVFRTDIEVPKVVLVSGPPGSMKTSFCYSMMSSYLDNANEKGLYITLEESADSHLNNMRSIGIKLSPNMEISDFTDLREIDDIVEGEGATDYLHLVEQTIRYMKKSHGDQFTVVTIDSLGALYSLMEDQEGMRKKMFYFFKNLRDFNLITFIVMERSPGTPSSLLGNEGFLVDGIIEMGMDHTRGKLARYIQVEKMRACDHSMERHTIEVGKTGLMVLGPALS